MVWQGFGEQLAAVGAALLGAGLLTWTKRITGREHQAFIGVLFVLAWVALGGTRWLGAFDFYGIFAAGRHCLGAASGVHLVFSSLIVPALTPTALGGRKRVDLPSGSVVCTVVAS